MKLLIVGQSGTTHALVWKLLGSTRLLSLVCAPGNGGTSLLVPSAKLPSLEPLAICHWAFSEGCGLIIPTDPSHLYAGLADEASGFRLGVFGLPQRVALLARSRIQAKEFLLRHRLPTPHGRCFDNLRTAERFLVGHKLPVVLRGDVPLDQDGVYYQRYDALHALEQIFASPVPPESIRGVIIEEHVPGLSTALSAVIDAETTLPLLPIRFYDRFEAGDSGVFAPGMGAYADNTHSTLQLRHSIHQQILEPLVSALRHTMPPHSGLVGVDCILGQHGPLVTGIRCSWSTLEAHVLLPRLQDDLYTLFEAAINNQLARLPVLRWSPMASIGLGLVISGYPSEGGDGLEIEGLADIDPGILIFHSQTDTEDGLNYIPQAAHQPQRDFLGTLATSIAEALIRAGPEVRSTPPRAPISFSTCGRQVLALVALGKTLQEARDRVYANAPRIRFQGVTFRTDIGKHE